MAHGLHLHGQFWKEGFLESPSVWPQEVWPVGGLFLASRQITEYGVQTGPF